ncbi:MAG: LysM domain-containing protein [Cyanobium sp.]
MKVTKTTTINELSTQLNLNESQLARLNRVAKDHLFHPGDLLALPESFDQQRVRIPSIDPAGAGLANPLPSSPPPTLSWGVVRLGDTLMMLAHRYGLTLAELLRFNPGLETARLVVGSQVRLSQSSAALRQTMPVGRNPVGSGGASWPAPPSPAAQPSAGISLRPSAEERPHRAPRRLNAPLDALERDGVNAPAERVRVHRDLIAPMGAMRWEGCERGSLSALECGSGVAVRGSGGLNGIGSPTGGGALSATEGLVALMRPLPPPSKPLSPKEQALLDRIRSNSDNAWRRYGVCNYDWGGWKLAGNGVRTTSAECGGSDNHWIVGVSCARLKVNRFRSDSGWQVWERPSGPENKFRAGEDEMMAALCANVQETP